MKRMSKQLTIKRDEIEKYEDLFRQVGAVGRGDTEDRNLFMKFKYAVGKNWKRLESELKIVRKKVQELMTPTPAYIEFMKRREEIAEQFATKDADGNVIYTNDKDDPTRQHRQFTPENQEAGTKALEELKTECALALAQYAQAEQAAQDYLNEEITIDLYSVPFEWVAERIAGAWLESVTIMVDDPPVVS